MDAWFWLELRRVIVSFQRNNSKVAEVRVIVSEASEIKRDGARAQKNSGRGKISKGDAVYRGFVVDYKEYENGIRITDDMWAKICSDAYAVGGFQLDPALKIILGKGNNKVRLYIISESAFDELTEGRE